MARSVSALRLFGRNERRIIYSYGLYVFVRFPNGESTYYWHAAGPHRSERVKRANTRSHITASTHAAAHL